MTRRVRLGWAVAALVLAGAAVTLIGVQHRPAHDFSALVDAETPAGRSYAVADATGPLDLRSASRATPLPADQVHRILQRAAFRGGYARVWTSGTAFVVSTALQVGDADRATAAAVSVGRDLMTLGQTQVQLLYGDLPHGTSYGFFVRKPSGIYQICTGVVFPAGREVHLVSMCDDTTPDPLMVHQRALTELRLARIRQHEIS